MEFKETKDEEDDLNTRCNFDYKKIKLDLNICRQHRHDGGSMDTHGDVNFEDDRNQIVANQYCDRCDWMFSELTLAASKMADYISSSVEQLVRLHFTSGLSRFFWCLLQCFKDDQEQLINKGLMLIQFVVMNAIALRKILKKYDKVHESANGMNFKSELQAKHLDILQSPWLIELVAFCINLNDSDSLISNELFGPLSFELNLTSEGSVLTLILLGSEKLDCSLICPICLDLVFQPYALSCGHIFCKSCACLAAHVLIIEGLKYASSDSKCPVCRESGVYDKSVCMSELCLLLQQRSSIRTSLSSSSIIIIIISMRKVATCFAEALARRIYRLTPQQIDPPVFTDLLQMHFYETCSYIKFAAHFTAYQAILEAFEGNNFRSD